MAGLIPFAFRGAAPIIIKASAGQVWMVKIDTVADTPLWVKFFNKATLPVLGTDTPIWKMLVTRNAPVLFNPGGGANASQFVDFTTGVAMAFSGDFADLDTTAAPGGVTVGNVYYI